MNRAAVPYGSSDGAPADVGNWESSGILDVSALFGRPGGTLFLADVQAHSIGGGPIAAGGLVAGGQLVLIEFAGSTATPAVSKVALHGVDEVIGSKFGDTIVGDAAADDLRGGRGADRIDGAGGNDALRGGRGSDFLAGKAGDDWLQGGPGADFLDGGANGIAGDTASYAASHRGVSVSLALTLAQSGRGDAKGDVLTGIENLVGSANNDRLAGNGEANTLAGGLGRDTLTGGAGRDIFAFRAAGETGNTATTRDKITDFEHAIDRIDLSAIDANGGHAGAAAFTLLASGAPFTGARAQLHWFHIDAEDRTIIEGDIDGDKKPDFQIELTGLKNLTVADFLL